MRSGLHNLQRKVSGGLRLLPETLTAERKRLIPGSRWWSKEMIAPADWPKIVTLAMAVLSDTYPMGLLRDHTRTLLGSWGISSPRSDVALDPLQRKQHVFQTQVGRIVGSDFFAVTETEDREPVVHCHVYYGSALPTSSASQTDGEKTRGTDGFHPLSH